MTYNAPKEKKKRVCKYCNKVYYKNYKYSETQWAASRFCSTSCKAASSRKHESSKSKSEAWRRQHGALVKGSPELNNKISELTKLAMQKPEVQEKIRQPRSALSLEHRMKVSDALVGKMPANNSYMNSGYSNVQRGWYDINGTTMYFRSKWEANYALYLDFLIDHKKIEKWEFEPDTFMFENIKLGTRSYTPDFKVFKNDGSIEYHEVKGYMDSKSQTKLKRMAKYYPEVKLLLIRADEYNAIKKQIGKLCKFY